MSLSSSSLLRFDVVIYSGKRLRDDEYVLRFDVGRVDILRTLLQFRIAFTILVCFNGMVIVVHQYSLRQRLHSFVEFSGNRFGYS